MPTPADPAARRERHRDPLTERLLRAARGDADAFAEVFDDVGGRVYGITLRVIGDPHRAEEVAQETLVEVWCNSSRFDPTKGSANAWITTIAHHRAVDCVRSSAAVRRRDTTWHEQRDDAGIVDTTFDNVDAHLRTQTIAAALGELPPTQRRAIELAYFDGHTYADVARLMKSPLGTTKTRIRAALIRLRQIMEPPHVDIA